MSSEGFPYTARQRRWWFATHGESVPSTEQIAQLYKVTRIPRKFLNDEQAETIERMGPMLEISGDPPDPRSAPIDSALNDLSRVPPDIMDKLRESGVTVHVMSTHPPGAEAGVSGSYDQATKKIAIFAQNRGTSESVALHEIGHAIGFHATTAGGTPVHYTDEIKAAHVRFWSKLPKHYQQSAPAVLKGTEELFAEGVAAVLLHRESAAAKYDEAFVSYIEGVLKQYPTDK